MRSKEDIEIEQTKYIAGALSQEAIIGHLLVGIKEYLSDIRELLQAKEDKSPYEDKDE